MTSATLISAADLPVVAILAAERLGCVTVGDLCARTSRDLDIGWNMLRQLQRELAHHGLALTPCRRGPVASGKVKASGPSGAHRRAEGEQLAAQRAALLSLLPAEDVVDGVPIRGAFVRLVAALRAAAKDEARRTRRKKRHTPSRQRIAAAWSGAQAIGVETISGWRA